MKDFYVLFHKLQKILKLQGFLDIYIIRSRSQVKNEGKKPINKALSENENFFFSKNKMFTNTIPYLTFE